MLYIRSMIFDNVKFSAALKKARKGLPLREVSAVSGVDHTVHLRTENGTTPSMLVFCRLCTWMKRKPSTFFTSQEKETK